jgi:hypothetical protein
MPENIQIRWRLLSSGMLSCVVFQKLTDISEGLAASSTWVMGGSKHIWNISQFLPDYMGQHCTRLLHTHCHDNLKSQTTGMHQFPRMSHLFEWLAMVHHSVTCGITGCMTHRVQTSKPSIKQELLSNVPLQNTLHGLPTGKWSVVKVQ